MTSSEKTLLCSVNSPHVSSEVEQNSSAAFYFRASTGKCLDNALLNVNCAQWDFYSFLFSPPKRKRGALQSSAAPPQPPPFPPLPHHPGWIYIPHLPNKSQRHVTGMGTRIANSRERIVLCQTPRFGPLGAGTRRGRRLEEGWGTTERHPLRKRTQKTPPPPTPAAKYEDAEHNATVPASRSHPRGTARGGDTGSWDTRGGWGKARRSPTGSGGRTSPSNNKQTKG